MKSRGSAAAVIGALGDEAAAEIERLDRAATAAVDAIRSNAQPAACPDADARLSAARDIASQQDAEEDSEDVRTSLADREAWIDAIVGRGRHAITASRDADALAWLGTLIVEAVQQLPGDACIVEVPAPTAGLLDDTWRTAIERTTGKRLSFERGAIAAGCIARTPDGKLRFDNSLAARERRTASEWRAALAQIYERAVASANEAAPAVAAAASARGDAA